MIRRSVAEDASWIRDLAARVYAEFGDYGAVMPAWTSHPGVLAFIEADDESRERRGFTLIGFYEPPEGPPGTLIADLLAIAVAPEHERQGIGKALLEHAIDVATLAGRSAAIRELRLTVADTNTRARRLFERGGFEVLDDYHGAYDGGQRAIRMRRPVARER